MATRGKVVRKTEKAGYRLRKRRLKPLRASQFKRNPSSSSSIFGWIAMLGGGYILLKMLGINPLSLIESIFGVTIAPPVTSGTTTNSTTPTPTTINTTNNPTPTTYIPPPPTPPLVDTKALVMQKVIASGLPTTSLLSFDQWNSYYQAVRGIPGPDPSQYLSESNRSINMSIDEWWGYMTKGGFSGMSGLGGYGIGMVVNMSPYTAGWNGPKAGQGLMPLGSETYAKWIN